MTWTIHRDDFSGLYAIKDGPRVVAADVGEVDAVRIAESVNDSPRGFWYWAFRLAYSKRKRDEPALA
jgi:hypothetical protein